MSSRPGYLQANSSSSIIPTSHPPPPPPPQARAATLRRGKTLTRPERSVAQPPLITPPAPLAPGAKPSFPAAPSASATGERGWDWWVTCSLIVTFWAPPVVLQACGFKDSPTRQAWREKITLCFICIVMGGAVAFLTMGLDKALCPGKDSASSKFLRPLGKTPGTVGVGGWVFNISNSVTGSVDFYEVSKGLSGQDTTNLFTRHSSDYPSCNSPALASKARFATYPLCVSDKTGSATESGKLQACPLGEMNGTTFDKLKIQNTTLQVGYSWADVSKLKTFLVVDGNVLNMFGYMSANPDPIKDDPVDQVIRTMLNNPDGGKDATKLLFNRAETRAAVPCLVNRYYAGHIDKITPGCFISTIFLYFALGIILGVILIRFAMACVFNWFLSSRMILPPKDLSRTAVSPMVMPSGANTSVNDPAGTAPWRGGTVKRPVRGANGKSTIAPAVPAPLVSQSQIGSELFTVCLITCYSESRESIKGTCDSIALTNYSDNRKLLFIVADGMVTGDGETASTPDHCVGLLDADERFGNPMPMGYIAVGSGRKRENRAMVYAGHYIAGTGRDVHRVPTVVVVKCGMPAEASEKKPGNRGKRDSQLILMNFFSRVTYNDRMSPLDFDLFRKIQVLMGVTPDFFETCLMVDADTVVYRESMKHLVNCMQHDRLVMGVCGETRVANKRQSWVTAIQVYEYFISHHQSKAFESVFGGVTCLPGCFSMYRLKSRKMDDDNWIPIITLPDIVREYSQSEVSTLHQKNLLLLGEDRFLSTLMLRTFPNRKMMFCPQARCRTVAPDTFSVLLSQRRRWINSTIHNLMELVRVRNLCGTFCFSMQFVVFMDLVGTVTLPIAICLTAALIINSILTPPTDFTSAIPLVLLAAVLGLPAVLILITTGKFIYVCWMFIYLLALPIWNFVLPVYSFWHFDDFSWGETRKVVGELKGEGHDDDKSVVATTVPLRRWEDWERSRLRRIKREERRRRDLERMERAFQPGGPDSGPSFLLRDPNGLNPNYGSDYDGSDAGSMFSSGEEDQWGGQMGDYNENSSQFPPPPIAFDPSAVAFDSDGEVVDANDLDAMLDQGFDDPPHSANNPFTNGHASYNSLGPQISVAPPQMSSTRSLTGPNTMQRFALSDDGGLPPPPQMRGLGGGASGYSSPGAYIPFSPSTPNSADRSHSTAVESRHVKQRSGGGSKNYGPGGPLMEPPAHHKPARF